VYEETYTGDNEQEQGRQSIDLKRKGDIELARLYEIEQVHIYRAVERGAIDLEKDTQRYYKGCQDSYGTNDTTHRLGNSSPTQPIDQETDEGK